LNKRFTPFFCTGLLLAVLLTVSFYATSAVQASSLTIEEQGEDILSNILGLDATSYDVTTKTYQPNNSTSFLETVTQETVAYEFISATSKMKAFATFADDNLQTLYVFEEEGNPLLLKTGGTDALENAKTFLTNYQAYTKNSLFGELKSTLDIVATCENLSKTVGNINIEVEADEGSCSFKWYYTCNGVEAVYSKFVTLVFKDDFLGFVDNWQLYSVGSTSVNLTEKDAIAVALETAKTYAYSLKLDDDAFSVARFNESNVRWTSLIFDASVDADYARGEDVSDLFPVWRVGVAFDMWYGQLYGVEVDVWADTGEVRSISGAWSSMPAPEGASLVNVNDALSGVDSALEDNQPVALDNEAIAATGANSLLIVLLVVLIFCGSMVFFVVSKRPFGVHARVGRFRRVRLVCVLVLAVLVLVPVEAVSAETQTAVIWGSESAGATGYPLPEGPSWRKSHDEVIFQQNAARNISNFFAEGGWVSHNNQGTQGAGSYVNQIKSDIQTYTANSDYVAFVDFDHGVGYTLAGEFHFMLEDQTGTKTGPYRPNTYPPRENHLENAVFDKDVYSRTADGKTMFSFINTCHSASLTNLETGDPWQGPGIYGARGMSYAFTHRIVVDKSALGANFNVNTQISDDAYSDPDNGGQVFIGFVGGSASLSQKLPYDTGAYPYQYWVLKFFYYSASIGMPVNWALDVASLEMWGLLFSGQTNPLSHGFDSYWWNPDSTQTYDGCMAVYGNGRINLSGGSASLTSIGAGDLNKDGIINYLDISAFMDAYIAYYSGQAWDDDADLNGDNKVNYLDISDFMYCYICYYQYTSTDSGDSSGELDTQFLDDDDGSASMALVAPSVLPAVGECFNVTVHVDNASDVLCWGGGLSWDSSVLQLCNVSEGSFLSSIGGTMFLCSIMDPLVANGSLQDICGSSLSGGVNGSGDLATLTFEVMSAQPTSINFTCGELFSTAGESMPCTLENLTITQDVLVTEVECGVSFVQSGGFVFPINVTLQNLGNVSRLVEVDLYANGCFVGQDIFGVAANCSVVVCCLGNSSMLPAGNYSLGAFVFVVDGLDCSFGHSLFEGEVLVTYVGDLTGDFRVNFFDIGAFMDAYSNYVNYAVLDPAADYDHDGDIDDVDAALFNVAYIAYYS
jgi:hypothetical protein